MPSKRSPCTLVQVCLLSIARNMDKLWCKDYEKNFGGKGFVMFTLGPFEYMDSDMIQGVINILIRTQKLRRIHLDLLITSRLKHLHLQLPPSIPISPVIKMVTCRCQQLVELTLSLDSNKSQSGKNVSLLIELVKGLPHIAYLDLSESSCSDDVLVAIGSNCKRIKVLKVKGCPVTDVGLLNLCMSRDSEKICQYLNTLDVTRTAVTARGLAIVLDKLENIQFLYHDDTGTPLWQLHRKEYQRGLEVPESKKHKLQTLKCHFFGEHFAFDESVHMFEIFSKYCPLLTTVDIVNAPSNDALLCLSSLRLKDLSLACDSDSTFITFAEGISPLLQNVGPTLEKLTLSDVNSIDVGEIGLHCRHLLHLQLQFYDMKEVVMYYTSNETLVRQQYTKPFSKLQSIDFGVLDRNMGDFSAVLQSLLTSSTSLKSLSLQNVHSFSESLLHKVLASNELKDFETLYLTGCDEIAGHAIEALLRRDDQLCKMALHNCKNIYRRHYEDMLTYIKEMKFDVALTWS